MPTYKEVSEKELNKLREKFPTHVVMNVSSILSDMDGYEKIAASCIKNPKIIAFALRSPINENVFDKIGLVQNSREWTGPILTLCFNKDDYFYSYGTVSVQSIYRKIMGDDDCIVCFKSPAMAAEESGSSRVESSMDYLSIHKETGNPSWKTHKSKHVEMHRCVGCGMGICTGCKETMVRKKALGSCPSCRASPFESIVDSTFWS